MGKCPQVTLKPSARQKGIGSCFQFYLSVVSGGVVTPQEREKTQVCACRLHNGPGTKRFPLFVGFMGEKNGPMVTWGGLPTGAGQPGPRLAGAQAGRAERLPGPPGRHSGGARVLGRLGHGTRGKFLGPSDSGRIPRM